MINTYLTKNGKRKVVIHDPDYYYKKQHAIRGNDNGNDLHRGHRIVIQSTGYWDGKRHYGVFVKAFDAITGAESATNIKYFKEIKNA